MNAVRPKNLLRHLFAAVTQNRAAAPGELRLTRLAFVPSAKPKSQKATSTQGTAVMVSLVIAKTVHAGSGASIITKTSRKSSRVNERSGQSSDKQSFPLTGKSVLVAVSPKFCFSQLTTKIMTAPPIVGKSVRVIGFTVGFKRTVIRLISRFFARTAIGENT